MNDYSDVIYLMGAMIIFSMLSMQESKEETPRYLELGSGDRELDALYFNSFAW